MASNFSAEIERLSRELGGTLHSRGLKLVTAESCTGGWIAQAVTAVPGSSHWFDRGYVTYSNAAKRDELYVSEATLQRYGAVSEECVRELVTGALERSGCDVALAVSGIAGPGGGTAQKPVGTVCFGWGARGAQAMSATRLFSGERASVREQAVAFALQAGLDLLKRRGGV
jgi:nicotinamide-nucleotide amidase